MAPSSVEHSGRIAQVVPLLRLHHLGGRRFDYLIPDRLAGAVTRGSLVTVPFGKRTVQAVVVGTGPSPDVSAAELRELEALAPDAIDPELVDLAEAVAERYLCSLESCLRLVAPIGAARGRTRPAAVRKDHVRPAPDAGAACGAKLTPKQEAVLAAAPANLMGYWPLNGACWTTWIRRACSSRAPVRSAAPPPKLRRPMRKWCRRK